MRNAARLVFPALRRRRGSFAHEEPKIAAALAAGVGGFILFGGTRAAVAALTRSLRARAGRALLIGSDLERGAGQQLRGLTELPPPGALGYLDDLDATYGTATITATEARAAGINWVFAPVSDLDVEPRNPIVQTRAFGSDPERVAAHVAAWVRGCQEHDVMACAKHYPGHGRTTVDSHEVLPVVEAPAALLEQTDLVPFRSAVAAGVGSVMTAHVSYPGLDPSGAGATFSTAMLDRLRVASGFGGLIVTDAFIMAGATAAQSEPAAAVAAVAAGCDVLLYPTDWAAVVRALEDVPEQRAEAALARYAAALETWVRPGAAPELDDLTLRRHQEFADGLADRAVHLLRGARPPLASPFVVSIVDDDVGGPYTIPPRDAFHGTLRAGGARLTSGRRPGVSGVIHIVLVYAEPRSWKGRAELGARSLAALERLLPGAALVVLFAHPRLAGQITGEAPVLCCWHGQALMQRAAARWVLGAVR